MTFLEAAKRVLAQAGKPLSAKEITRRALARGLILTKGKTPEATMRTALLFAARKPETSGIVKAGRGLWALSKSPARAKQQGAGAGGSTTPASTSRRYWLLVTNPEIYKVEKLFRKGYESWDAVHSTVCQKRIREEVRPGDLALVYEGKPGYRVVAQVEVVKGPFPKAGFHAFDVGNVRRLTTPVTLRQLRRDRRLQQMEFLRNTRNAVSRLTPEEYHAILELAEEPPLPERLAQAIPTLFPGAPHVSQEPQLPEDSASHDEVHWWLVKLGELVGCDVWVAPDARNRSFAGEKFSAHTLDRLPHLGFNEATEKLVRGIDVLWLRGNVIEAAFEIEHTTSIYSGLLRLSDLVALQPNVSIKLYIVAPSSRKSQVIEQIRRPTFDRLPKPLKSICRLVTYDVLRQLLEHAEKVPGYLKPEVIDTKAESCE